MQPRTLRIPIVPEPALVRVAKAAVAHARRIRWAQASPPPSPSSPPSPSLPPSLYDSVYVYLYFRKLHAHEAGRAAAVVVVACCMHEQVANASGGRGHKSHTAHRLIREINQPQDIITAFMSGDQLDLWLRWRWRRWRWQWGWWSGRRRRRRRGSRVPFGMISSATSRCQLRLAQQGHGAVQPVVVGLFVHILARYSQRGSRKRQTGAMV